MLSRTRLTLLAVVGLVVFPNAAGGELKPNEVSRTVAKRPVATTLLTVRGPILLFAHDGDHVAWSGGCGLVIRNLRTRAQLRERGQGACPEFGGTRRLALGGPRALWTTIGCGTSCYTDVYTRALGERRALGLVCCDSDGGLAQDGGGAGSHVSAVAADGGALVYGALWSEWHPLNCADSGARPCEVLLRGGVAQRVFGRSKAAPLEIPPAAIAVSGGRLAIVPKEAKGCACNRDPAWSPNGRSIAFTSLGEGPDFEIASVSPTGGTPAAVTKNFRYDFEPDWSPDGTSLVFTSPDAIRIAAADGTGERVLVEDCDYRCSGPAWSPDGSRIAFAKESALYVIRPDGSDSARLTPGSPGYDGNPAWSPDGQKIAFTRTPQDPGASRSEIWLMDADGSNQRRLANGESPSWATSGMIAFQRHDGRDLELHVINADGGNERRLTDNLVDDSAPDWSPDAARIAFVRSSQDKDEVFVMSVDAGGVARVTDTRPVLTFFPAEVRGVTDGALISRFMPNGKALAIALSSQFAAVLVQQGRAKRIELYDPSSGARRGAVSVSRTTSARLSIAGHRVVYRTGRVIRMIDANKRRKSVLLTAKAPPIGLSIEGNRVAWAESGKKRSRIRGLLLPTPAPATADSKRLGATSEAVLYSSARSPGSVELHAVDVSTRRITRLTAHTPQGMDAVWSPDGRELAFSAGREGGSGAAGVWTIRRNGSRARPLTNDRGDIFGISYSPDGKRLAFADGTTLWLLNRDGSQRRSLLRMRGELRDPAWSPDGARIAFGACNRRDCALYVLQIRGRRVTRLTRRQSKADLDSEAAFAAPAWSPNGSSLAAVKESAIGTAVVVVNARRPGERVLAPGHEALWLGPTRIALVARGVQIVSVDGRRLRSVDGAGYEFALAWATGAQKLVFASETRRGVRFFSADPLTGRVRRLARRIGSVRGDRSWAPDGSLLALNRSWRDGITDSVHAIDLVDLRRRSRRLLRPAADSHPSVSPDGRQIVFARRVERRNEILVMGSDGTNERRLASGTAPQWSPAGQTIAFLRGGSVYLIGADGRGERRVGTANSFSFSSGGTLLALARRDAIFIADTTGPPERRITGDLSSCTATVFDPQWARDGRRISFTVGGCDLFGREIFVARTDGSQTLPLGEGEQAKWSPIQERLVFHALGVFLMRPDGSERSQIAEDGDVPVWSPDGRRIAFVYARAGTTEIHVVNADGTDERAVASNVALTTNVAGAVLPVQWLRS